jgi:predicted MFS family arabinose efflux permease
MSEASRLWRHRDFLLLWGGQTTSDVGTAVSAVVLPLIAVVYLHVTAFEVGALAAAEWAPWLLIGLPAGVWIDRSRCRPVMIACDVARALLIGSVPLAAAFDRLTIGHLFVAAFGTGAASVLFQVAYQSFLPRLLDRDDLPEGNAKLQGSGAVAQVAGPGLGGALVQAFRAPYALLADVASYAVSALALLGLRHREERPPPAERNLRREIAEGARYVRADPILRVLTIAPAITNFFFTGAESITVLFLVRTVRVEPAAVGLLIGGVSLGSVLGAVLARPIGRRIGTSRAVWLVTLGTAPFGLLIAATQRGLGLALFVVGSTTLFAGILVYNVTIGGFRQAYCPPAILGRVVATMRFVLFGTIPLGALAGGGLASALGSRTALYVLLSGNCIAGLILLASPLRGLRDLPDHPPVQRVSESALPMTHT